MTETILKNINWVDRLTIEYREGRKALRVKRSSLNDTDLDKLDKSKINSMINEMSEIIKWLETGKDPQDFKSNDRRSAYQRRVILEMDLFPSLDIVPDSFEQHGSGELTEGQKELVMDVLLELSARERECYLLHYANMRSFNQISIELGITKASVQSYINRARGKVNKKISCHTGAI